MIRQKLAQLYTLQQIGRYSALRDEVAAQRHRRRAEHRQADDERPAPPAARGRQRDHRRRTAWSWAPTRPAAARCRSSRCSRPARRSTAAPTRCSATSSASACSASRRSPGPAKDTPFRELLVNKLIAPTLAMKIGHRVAVDGRRADARRRCSRGCAASTTGPFSVLAAGERIAYPEPGDDDAARGRGDRHRARAHRSDREHHADARRDPRREAGSDDRRALGRPLRARRRRRRARRGLPRDGAPVRAPARALDEQVATMRRVWNGEAPIDGDASRRARARATRWPAAPCCARWGRSRWPAPRAGPTVWPASTSPPIRRESAPGSGTSRRRGRTRGAPARRSCRRRSGSASTPTRPTACADYAYRYLRIFGDEAAAALAGLVSATSPTAVRDCLAGARGRGLRRSDPRRDHG